MIKLVINNSVDKIHLKRRFELMSPSEIKEGGIAARINGIKQIQKENRIV